MQKQKTRQSEVYPSNFFYIRHAITDAHVQKLLCGGGWDIPINDAGIKQAIDAAKQYSEHLKTATVILSSPLLRARQTADIFSKCLNIPFVIVDDFQEWNLGDWEKQPSEAVPNLFTRSDDPPNGETRIDFLARVIRGLEYVNGFKSPALIVGHGALWFEILKVLRLDSRPIHNCVPFYFNMASLFEYSLQDLSSKTASCKL